MAEIKRYYYMRLNENYFDSDTQVLLESMPDGYLYSNILLKLYLKSLKSDGRLMFNEKIPYSPQMIATITRHQLGTVEKALKVFKELNIIDIIDSGAIYMLDIQNYIGKSNNEADRKRAYRNKIEKEKGQMSHSLSQKCPLEIEIEKEIENRDNIYNAINDIITYLNKQAKTNYKSNNVKTKSLINARLNEGFTIEDFKKVIDIKTNEWGNDSIMNKYLRPETLFGTKFESYLNQKDNKPSCLKEVIKEEKELTEEERKIYEEITNSWC